MGTAPVELKKESGSQEVRSPAIFHVSSVCITSHLARISSFLSHATDMMSSSQPTLTIAKVYRHKRELQP